MPPHMCNAAGFLHHFKQRAPYTQHPSPPSAQHQSLQHTAGTAISGCQALVSAAHSWCYTASRPPGSPLSSSSRAERGSGWPYNYSLPHPKHPNSIHFFTSRGAASLLLALLAPQAPDRRALHPPPRGASERSHALYSLLLPPLLQHRRHRPACTPQAPSLHVPITLRLTL